jgi:hypothetical protein
MVDQDATSYLRVTDLIKVGIGPQVLFRTLHCDIVRIQVRSGAGVHHGTYICCKYSLVSTATGRLQQSPLKLL